MSDLKPTVSFDETFAQLDIRVGRILTVERCEGAPKPAYRIEADFGKYGRRVTVGRFTCHSVDELVGQSILGVLNFEARDIGGVVSEFLCLGVQFPKADSGEATPLVPLNRYAKLGGKVF
jgi:tRNA-binding protein